MPPQTQQTPVWNEELIRRHDLAGPRYTSYPTAPQFKTDFDHSDWLAAVARSNASGRPLSLYFHIPFCDTVCYYCGCNKIITANKQKALPYLESLHQEIEMQAKHIQTTRPVNQLHLGGGTPTYISDDQLSALIRKIRAHFQLLDDDSGEYSIEIHPHTVNPQRLAHLRMLGFNRLSLGVQDFNPEVQRAVNRFNSHEEVATLVNAGRQLGFQSISLDLIYGLPKQSVEGFAATLNQVIELRPDRLSLFNYAHMPHLFKVQKQINANELPEPQDKLHILHNSIDQLMAAGYVYIGMDHFALPEDELSQAQNQGKLHRNFQGYATHGNCDLLAFGLSSISSIDNTFSQNAKDLEQYIQPIRNGHLSITKGITLCEDDLIRRRVINALICHFELDFDEISEQCQINFKNYFAKELASLHSLADDHLISLYESRMTVSDTGRLLIRRICMTFDAYLQNRIEHAESPRYSRII